MKFNCCITNPPYCNALDCKIILRMFDFVDTACYVNLSTWLFKQQSKFKQKIKNYINSIHIFNFCEYFVSEQLYGVSTPIVVTLLDLKKCDNERVKINMYNETFDCDVCDITKFGKDWFIIKPFVERLKQYVINHGSIETNRLNFKYMTRKTFDESKENKPDKSLFYVQIPTIRGKYSTNDMYTLMMKPLNDNKGVRKSLNSAIFSFAFKTEKEQDNFVNYCASDFCRWCLSIYKINEKLDRGEMSLIPWLDFTRSWTDDELCNMFKITKEQKDVFRKHVKQYY